MGLAAKMLDGYAVVEVEYSRLDASNSETFKNGLKEMIDSGQRQIILDFKNVQFMDSSGLGAVVGCLKYMGSGGSIEIANPSATVMKILKLTRMNKVFNIRDIPS